MNWPELSVIIICFELFLFVFRIFRPAFKFPLSVLERCPYVKKLSEYSIGPTEVSVL